MMRNYQRNIELFETRIEELKNIKLNAFPVLDDRYVKAIIRAYFDRNYTNFPGLIVPEDDIECETFIVIFIDSLLVYESKNNLQVYLDKCACKTVNKQMTDYPDRFEDQIL